MDRELTSLARKQAMDPQDPALARQAKKARERTVVKAAVYDVSREVEEQEDDYRTRSPGPVTLTVSALILRGLGETEARIKALGQAKAHAVQYLREGWTWITVVTTSQESNSEGLVRVNWKLIAVFDETRARRDEPVITVRPT